MRLRTFHCLYIDDAFVLLAWLTIVANTVIWQVEIRELYLSIAVASGQIPLTALPNGFLKQTEKFLHLTFASYFCYHTSLWSVKVSFLLFFRKLGNHIRSQRIVWWCVTAFTIASYCVCLGLDSTKCLLSSSESELGKTGPVLLFNSFNRK